MRRLTVPINALTLVSSHVKDPRKLVVQSYASSGTRNVPASGCHSLLGRIPVKKGDETD